MSRPATCSALLIVIALASACDKVALLAPTGSTVTLSVGSTSIGSNGTAEVVATVIESAGTPVHDGTQVTFQASVGKVDPAVVRTEGGLARTTFFANGSSGTARIVAFSGGARSSEVEVRVGSAAAETVTVRVSPSSVPQTGGTVQVSALVRDASGNPLPGAQVAFAADNGTLSSNTAVTNEQGEATTTLQTNRQTVVRASVAGKEGQATVSVVNLPGVTITASTTTPNVGVPVTFTITPASTTNGNPLQNVTFDPGDGSPERNLGALTGPTTVSHTYTRAGTFQATATVTDTGGLRGQSSIAVVVQRSAVTVSIMANPTSANVGDPITFSINSSAGANGPPIQSVRVTFPDGQSATVGAGAQTLVRSFNTPGTYVVRAVATDAAGTTAESTTSVVIRQRAAIEMTLDAASADGGFTDFSCSPAMGYPKTCSVTRPFLQPARVVFQAGFVGTAPSNVVSYTWNLGDGTTRTTTNRNTDHAYPNPGTYVVTVTANTADGGSGSQTLTLIVR